MKGLIKFIKFYSTSCRPCEIISIPWDTMKFIILTHYNLDRLDIEITEVNTDIDEESASDCSIRVVPSLIAATKDDTDKLIPISQYKGELKAEDFLEWVLKTTKEYRNI